MNPVMPKDHDTRTMAEVSPSSTTAYRVAREQLSDNGVALRVLKVNDQVEILGTLFRVKAVGPKGIRLKAIKRYGR